MKRCSRCRKQKPLQEFHRCSKKKDGLTPHYKSCHRTDSYDLDVWRARRFSQVYGITLEEYDEMYDAQGGRCAICREKNRGRGRLAVDHDHETGDVRGLLCFPCNTKLGWVERIGLDGLSAYLKLEYQGTQGALL